MLTSNLSLLHPSLPLPASPRGCDPSLLSPSFLVLFHPSFREKLQACPSLSVSLLCPRLTLRSLPEFPHNYYPFSPPDLSPLPLARLSSVVFSCFCSIFRMRLRGLFGQLSHLVTGRRAGAHNHKIPWEQILQNLISDHFLL